MANRMLKLTPELIRRIEDQLARVSAMIPELDRLESCGTNCQEYRRELESQRQRLTQLREKFNNAK